MGRAGNRERTRSCRQVRFEEVEVVPLRRGCRLRIAAVEGRGAGNDYRHCPLHLPRINHSHNLAFVGLKTFHGRIPSVPTDFQVSTGSAW